MICFICESTRACGLTRSEFVVSQWFQNDHAGMRKRFFYIHDGDSGTIANSFSLYFLHLYNLVFYLNIYCIPSCSSVLLLIYEIQLKKVER